MPDTTALLVRLRCQHAEIAHRAADAIERLVASEKEARKAFDELLDQQVQMRAQMQVTEIGGWDWRNSTKNR